MRARLWYHCTNTYHGELWQSELCLPRLTSDKEPPVPRLCVGPSIPACLCARQFWPRTVFVYACFCRAVAPRNVWDSQITRERWIVHRQLMFLYTTLSGQVLRAIQSPDYGKKGTWRLRIGTLARAVEQLPEFANRADKRALNITRRMQHD